MSEISIGLEHSHGRAVTSWSLIFLLLLAGCPAASPLASNVRLETSTDAERNSRELQEQLDELLFRGPRSAVILPRGDVFFSSGTEELDSTSRAHLAELAAFLIKYPSCTVMVEGHADSIGNREDNHRLSLRRADVVKAFLIHRGVDSNAVSVSAKGEGSPLSENASGQEHRWNRRVEVILDNLPVPSDEGLSIEHQ
jgi:outer membrane protein OmpA-like peptidoglycan-associated protein